MLEEFIKEVESLGLVVTKEKLDQLEIIYNTLIELIKL